jgi:2-dehydro-3-deoxyphosphogluconate aldolase/(4S)-4-hydroxy-2-oxoglutarate aldolase
MESVPHRDPAPSGRLDRSRTTTERILQAGLLAILRAPSGKHFPAVSEALVEAGVRVIELTLTAPDAVDVIAALVPELGDAAVIGAGTVVTAGEAEACIEAGAAFLVSPTAAPDVLAAARFAGVAAYPGAFTPTEILGAYRAGATAVKLFPASAVGPRFITDLHGPFPDIPILPSGGITIDEIPQWLAAGAGAVGLGGPLLGNAVHDGSDIDGLRTRARRATELVERARSEAIER